MTNDDNGTGDGLQDHAQEQMKNTSAEIGSQMKETVDQVAEAAQDAVDAAGAASIKASEGTAQAFGAARDRLQGLAKTSFGPNAFLDQFKAQTDVLAGPLGDSYQRAAKGMAEFNAKAIEAWRTNAEATIAHWQSLAGVKSLSDVIALNAEHARKQMDAMTAQTRELAELAGRISQDATQPIRGAAKKTGGF